MCEAKEKKYIILNHCGNPECWKDYLIQKDFSGSLPQCADRLQEIYDEYTEAGNTVTDYRDDPVDGDKLKEQVLNGWFTAMQVDNPTNEYFTLMEV